MWNLKAEGEIGEFSEQRENLLSANVLTSVTFHMGIPDCQGPPEGICLSLCFCWLRQVMFTQVVPGDYW